VGKLFARNGDQCCQIVHFQNKNSNLGKFWKDLQLKMLVFLWTFCLLYGQMVYFMDIWYILWSLGTYIFPVLVYCTDKNLATLMKIRAMDTFSPTKTLSKILNWRSLSYRPNSRLTRSKWSPECGRASDLGPML
jgi:hypothetical protein